MTWSALLAPSLLLAAPTAPAPASDGWPQYNGPTSARTADASLARAEFPARGPKVVWRQDTGSGFSSFVLAGDRAYMVDGRREKGEVREVLVALDASSGKEVWSTPLGVPEYDGGGGAGAPGNDGGDGPRSTPSIVDGRVYVYDAAMVLHAFDAKSGKEAWSVDVRSEHGGREIRWQNAASPLVNGGRVYVAGGGKGSSLLAFDAKSGELAWAVGDELMTHATPIAADLHGEHQIIFYVQSGLVALDPETGDERWRIGFPYRISSAASPVAHGEHVFVSAGYGVGGAVVHVAKDGDGFAPDFVWHKRNKRMNHWSTPVAKDGYLYGMFSFKKYGKGPMKCVEIATGDIMWEKSGFGPGNVILVGDHLVALGDAGQLVVVDATPDEYRERGRAELLDGKCWSSPAYADGRVYVRSTKEAACVELK
ncbi:MAG: PQQ-binding-like beta-propeller repeat protein [Planctomycetota bacterium]